MLKDYLVIKWELSNSNLMIRNLRVFVTDHLWHQEQNLLVVVLISTDLFKRVVSAL